MCATGATVGQPEGSAGEVTPVDAGLPVSVTYTGGGTTVTRSVTTDQDGRFFDSFTPMANRYTLTATVRQPGPVLRRSSASCVLKAADVTVRAAKPLR
jgi:hypothetical protein